MVTNMPDGENHELIFLLGAGASVEAGVPDTRKFIYGKKEEDGIRGFLEWLEKHNRPEELEILNGILCTFKENFKRKNNAPIIDVELVLGVLNALNNKENDYLIYFYDSKNFKFKSKDDEEVLKKLESDLRKFIREKVVIDEEDISYLAPLIEFKKPKKPINIFSMNYDTCIEMLCMKHKLTYTDGFGLYWEPENFEKKFDIKLFKLHGSIIWYLTDKENYVKLPVEMGERKEILLITGETALPFILYPTGRKWEYAEPLEHLITEFREHLKSADICIVVGYSFRDDDIRHIFFEAAKENPNLTIVLISLDAGTVFEEKLRYRDEEEQIPSPIYDRVICFNYPFGSVLKDNYLYLRCKNDIPPIKKTYNDAEEDRREGKREESKRKFKECINLAMKIGDVSTIEKIFIKELEIEPPNSWGNFNENERFSISYSLAIFYLLNGDKKGKGYFEYLRNSLQNVLDAGKKYFDLYMELNENEEKEKSKEEINRIKSRIENFEKQHRNFPFCYWSRMDNELNSALGLFKEFIQNQLELRARDDEISSLLKGISDSCEELLRIFETQYNPREYEGSKEVHLGNYGVKIQIKNNLENGLENLIELIDIEQYEKIIKDLRLLPNPFILRI